MSQRKDKKPEAGIQRPANAHPPSPVTPGGLAGLIALGALSGLLSVFLWGELLLVRQGGMPFCAFGAGADCATVWNSPFASSVHRVTGVPIAGWGLAWGLDATALPLFALVRAAEGRALPALVTAIRLTEGAERGAAGARREQPRPQEQRPQGRQRPEGDEPAQRSRWRRGLLVSHGA